MERIFHLFIIVLLISPLLTAQQLIVDANLPDTPAVLATNSSDTHIQSYAIKGIGYSGVYGVSNNYGIGIKGFSEALYGVFGESFDGYGVYGRSTSNYGVIGRSSSGISVYGQSADGPGAYFVGRKTNENPRLLPRKPSPNGLTPATS